MNRVISPVMNSPEAPNQPLNLNPKPQTLKDLESEVEGV